MNSLPKLKNIIKNDFGAFLCIWGPVLFATISLITFTINEYPFAELTMLELVASYISISLISLTLLPFVLWWYHIIKVTFKNGVEIEAIIYKKETGFGLGIFYLFTFNGKRIEHVAALVPNQDTKKALKKDKVSVMYNAKKNVSFIKEIYC